MDCCFSELTL